MESRYLYRGKRIDNREWVEGFLFMVNDVPYILPHHKTGQPIHADNLLKTVVEVLEDTICQCTGLKDKNGKLIWENDIVSFEDTGEEGYEYKEGFDFVNKAKVEFAEGRWSLTDFVSDNSGVMDEMYDHAEFMEFWQYCEVIGNKFDNPELLEV
ncbi:YopX family protein [Clostridium fessum]|jgi:uncharacterized phage protein (TIGR01671 family)|uniref:YopX family protein n=1 Tax=Clostridium fessum TaxID=2126740 RepID=UPI003AF0FA0F